MERLPVSVLTGYLGSGKTTLLNKMLRDPGAAGTAVIVNEFGDIGLDHDLVESSDDSIVLLANGCLCCAVRGDLVKTLREMRFRPGRGFSRVAIECSGLADPCAILQMLLTDPVVSSQYELGAVLCTLDAVNGLATLDRQPESLRQLALSDRVALTKLDLVPEAETALREKVSRINPGAAVVLANQCAFSDPPVLPTPRIFETTQAHHGSSGIQSFSLVRDDPLAMETLELILRGIADNLGPDLLRVKGILNIAGKEDRPAVLHGAQAVLHDLVWLDQWPSDDRRSRMVFITQGVGRAAVEEIVEIIEKMAARDQRRKSAAIT